MFDISQQITIDTHNAQIQNPKGRGNWTFWIGGTEEEQNKVGYTSWEKLEVHNALYTDAAKAAIRQASMKGLHEVVLI